MGLIAFDKFKPILFVGLGGNGGKIVNQLAGRLKRHENWDRIRDLTHFLAIDTNKDDMDKLGAIPPDCRFLVSAFNAASYIERKRGQGHNDADPLVTQWIPADYKFRKTQGAGAGQIRIESRLRLYYNLEDDRARIRQTVTRMLQTATGRDNPYRDNEDRVVRVILFGSVAGGTGSGGFLPMAYLLRRLVEDKGWGRPSVSAVLSLPTTFLQHVKPQLHDDIKANGYAALKELEYLTRELGYDGGVDRLKFHYDPGTNSESRTWIDHRPFDIVYLIDQPANMSIDRYEHAVADSCFLQIFSSLLGHQAGEYDNYEKRQQKLAAGHFSVHYAAMGTALLQLPRKDLIRYSGLRYVSRAFREYLCFGGDDPRFAVPYGQPSFERLEPEEKNRIIDTKFVQFVAYRADEEREREEKGIFTAIHEQRGEGNKDLHEAFAEELSARFSKIEELVEFPDFKIQSITEANPSVAKLVTELREKQGINRTRVMTEYLSSQKTDLKTGRFFSDFFKRWKVNPIAQRLFLIKALERDFIVPFADPAEGVWLQEGLPISLDSEDVRRQVQSAEKALTASSNQGTLARWVTDRDNAAFRTAKKKGIALLNKLADELREDLQRDFWRGFEQELRLMGQQLLSSFRMVAEIADTRAREAETRTESFRKDPGAEPDSDIAQYYLDAEVLRDDRRKERLWHVFFLHHLDKSSYFRTDDIFPLVTAAFLPKRDPDGRIQARDATDIVEDVRVGLVEKAQEIYTTALGERGLDLDLAKGLEYEQRYIALLDQGLDPVQLHREGRLDGEAMAVPDAVVLKGIEDKLGRLADECVLLAHIDEVQLDDPTVTRAELFYAGLADRYHTDEDSSLGKILGERVRDVNFVQGWGEQDSLVLYRAMLGIPVYFFKNVKSELEPSYVKVFNEEGRSYALHIEADWEDPGIPDLDPIALRRAEEQKHQEARARSEREEREAMVLDFTLCLHSGTIEASDEGFKWSYFGSAGNLGKGRIAAFEGFMDMGADMRKDLSEEVWKDIARRSAEKRPRTELASDLSQHLKRLKGALFAARQEERESEQRFIKEERVAIEALIARLEAGEPVGRR